MIYLRSLAPIVWASVGFLVAVILAGCSVAPLQAARTEATLEFGDGRRFHYSSNKEQSGIDARIFEIDPKTGKVIKEWHLKVEKTGTPEAAYAAMVQQQNALTQQQQAITKLIQAFLERAAGAAPIPGQ